VKRDISQKLEMVAAKRNVVEMTASAWLCSRMKLLKRRNGIRRALWLAREGANVKAKSKPSAAEKICNHLQS